MSPREPGGRLAAASPEAARLLPQVVPDAPAAVLLVDVSRGTVVYASPVAEQLAPSLSLPFDAEAWVGAADLRVVPEITTADEGRPRTPSLGDLAVGKAPQGVVLTAQRASDMSSERELLWATGLPLTAAPGLDDLGLVVLLPLRDGDAIDTALAAVETEAELRERAVLATGLSFTVADALHPDQPLVWVNPAFTATTGYSFEDAVGRNCRFLQGPATDPAAPRRIREAISGGEALVTTLLNYRQDGTPFWNQLALNPVRDAHGTVTHYVGIQTDVTERRRIEAEREHALAAERAAREAAESARQAAEAARQAAERAMQQAERATQEALDSRRRLSLLAEATSLLAGTLDLDETLDRLVRLVLPLLADWVVVNVLGAEDGLHRRVIVADVEGPSALTAELERLHDEGLGGASLTHTVLGSGRPALRRHWSDTDVVASFSTPEMRDVVRRLGIASALSVPLRARNRLLGVMTFVRRADRRPYDEDDLEVAADLGRRAALALDNARLYQVEHQNAETLQRSLLPDLPEIAGVQVAARYKAGTASAEVGGDFYELLDLPDGRVGIAIGDVVGHDLTAAAAMGHLRGLLRACAWDTANDNGGSPGTVLERVDRLVQGLHVAPLATIFYARLQRPGAPGGDWRLEYANGGHLPPVVRHPDGSTAVLDAPPGLLLGVQLAPYGDHAVPLPAGSTLFCFTDGLVERRDADIDTGTAWLRALLEAAPRDAGPQELVDLAVRSLARVEDDVAVLAVRVG